jgi:lipopolysaccharide export system permease protein
MGWTLTRYFLLRYAVITIWIALGVAALIFLATFTELASRLASIPGVRLSHSLAIASLRTPVVVLQTIPFVALFSAMATLISLNRRYELVVARSAGISAWQFLVPLCIGAFLFGMLATGILNPLSAYALSRSEIIETELRSGNSNVVSAAGAPWIRQKSGENDSIVGARAVLNQGLTLADASFFTINPDGELVERTDATRAYLRDGLWQLENVKIYRDGASFESRPSLEIPTTLKPEFVQERLARPETIPFFELPRKIEAARSFGLRADAFSMQFHSLIALPPLLVAMTLIAATVSMRFARLGQSATMLLGGVAAGFLLYVVSVLVRAFGNAGIMSPLVAAWAPVVIAVFFGVTYLLYKEDG